MSFFNPWHILGHIITHHIGMEIWESYQAEKFNRQNLLSSSSMMQANGVVICVDGKATGFMYYK